MITYLYFDNGQSGTPLFNTLDVVTESSPGVAWSSPVACTLNGAVMSLGDPQINLLPNTQYLLSYTTYQGGPSGGEIDTAISSDGIHFTSVQLAVAAPANSSVTDPSIVQLPDGTFLMVVAVNGPSQTTETFYSSSDGRTWAATGATIPNMGAGGLAVMPDGSIRFYVGAPGIGGGPGGVGDFKSHDNGQTWSGDPGLCITTSSNAGLPSVWETAPGHYDMVFQTLIDLNGPNIPSNQELSLATSTDGRNFTLAQADFLVQASSADGLTSRATTVDDFYGSGTSDVLFRDNATGDVGFYKINNGADAGWIDVGPSSTAYSAVGVGDFYNSGTDDILFRNNVSGDVGFYAMNNGADTSFVEVGPSSTAYTVAGVGDFFGAGTSDILFRNNSTGDVGFYAINNGADAGWYDVGPSSTAYSVIGVGDFYGNGTDDILFINYTTGDVGFYAISNGADVGWMDVGPSSTAYTAVGTGDFYGNGTSDILFRNSSTGDGDVGFYAISNGADTGWHEVGPSSTAYAVVGVGDYMGNGTDDILFRNNTTGDVGFYEINNGMDVGWVDVGPSSPAYNVVPDTSDNGGAGKIGGPSGGNSASGALTPTGVAPVAAASGSANTSDLLYTPVAATGSVALDAWSWKGSKPQTLATDGFAMQWPSGQPVSAGVIALGR